MRVFSAKFLLMHRLCVTEWMAKNTVPVSIWGVPVYGNGEGDEKLPIRGPPITIRCL